MRSLGFYYKIIDDNLCPKTKKHCPEMREENPDTSVSNKEEAEIHCNLWKVQRDTSGLGKLQNPKYDFLLDVGIQFNCKIKTLALYFPFELSNEGVIDLGQTIIQNQELCCLIFNEDVITAHVDDCFSLVGFKDNKKALWIYPIAQTNYNCEKAKEKQKGTILKISINSDPLTPENSNLAKQYKKNYIYIRFRIKLSEDDLINFKREELLSRDIVQSIFSKVEMFDFRINDKREINKKIDEYLRNIEFNTFRMSKVHFFLMCDTRNNIDKASMRCQSRFLETDKWATYVMQPIPQSMIAYHWKDQTDKELIIHEDKGFSLRENLKLSDLLSWERKSFSNFRLFFMLTYPQRSLPQILFYCLLAIFLGSVGSIVASVCFQTEYMITGIVIISIIFISVISIWIYLKNRSSVKFFR